MQATKKYVGMANAFPASFTPRRFPNVRIAITEKIMYIFPGSRDGNVEMIAATPAAD